MTDAALADDRSFFGHPRGLGYLLGAELFYAFAIYGLQTMLTLYMTQSLLRPGHVEHVWGFAAYEGVLRTLYGPLTPLRIASQTFGLWGSLIFAFPILGAILADRWLGQRRAVLIGFTVMTAAFACVVAEQTFLIAIILMIIGVGLLKTSFIGQIGRLYGVGDDRRTRAFGLYLIAVNIGSMTAPLIAGTLGERVGWGYGLAALASGMALATACYVAGVRHMPSDMLKVRQEKTVPAVPKLRPGDGLIVFGLVVLAVLDAITVGTYNQAWNVFPVWAETHVDRRIFGFVAPVTWFATLDGLLTILGAVLAVRWWAWEDKRNPNPNEVRRIAAGFVMLMLAFVVLAAGAYFGRNGVAPLGVAVGFFVLADFSIPWTDTVVMTVVTRDAPAPINSTMIGVYYLCYGAGSFLTGWLGGFADRMSMPAFWLMHATLLGATLIGLILFGGRLHRILQPARAQAFPAV